LEADVLFATYLWILSALFGLGGLIYLIFGGKALEFELRIYEKAPRWILVVLCLLCAAAAAVAVYGGITTPGLGDGWRFDLIAVGGLCGLWSLIMAFTLRGELREHFMVKPWLCLGPYCWRAIGFVTLVVAYALCLMARTVSAFARLV
jgi:hypothetical protein